MEYVIIFMVAALVAILATICAIALVSFGDDEKFSDDERLDSIRGALEEQSAPWRPHVRSSK